MKHSHDTHGHEHPHDDHEHHHSHPHHHDHDHALGHSHHFHDHAPSKLLWPLLLTLGFALVEAFGGWYTHSLALMGDAGHMFSDSAALGLAWLAAWVARKPPTQKLTFGLGRVEVIVAVINGVVMLLVVAAIVYEAILRIRLPQPVAGGEVMLIALVGLLVNILVAWQLHQGEQTLNSRAALLHVMGDLLGSVAALVAGGVILLTGWTQIDPILSILISGLIIYSTYHLLTEAIHVLMEGVPPHLDIHVIESAMHNVAGVQSVHDVHVWTLSSGVIGLSAHVVVKEMTCWREALPMLQDLLKTHYGIEHSTLQPEDQETYDCQYVHGHVH